MKECTSVDLLESMSCCILLHSNAKEIKHWNRHTCFSKFAYKPDSSDILKQFQQHVFRMVGLKYQLD